MELISMPLLLILKVSFNIISGIMIFIIIIIIIISIIISFAMIIINLTTCLALHKLGGLLESLSKMTKDTFKNWKTGFLFARE